MGVTDGIKVLLCSPNPQCQVTSSVPLQALHVSSQSEIHAMDAVLAGSDIYRGCPRSGTRVITKRHKDGV